MGKTKISRKRKRSLKNIPTKQKTLRLKKSLKIEAYNPTKSLLNEEKIGKAIWECLKAGDSEGVIEIIQTHLEAVNKTRLAKQAGLAKTTMHHAFRSKNPTIKTLAKLIHATI